MGILFKRGVLWKSTKRLNLWHEINEKLAAWGSPIEPLCHWKQFQVIKSALTTDYFEQLIKSLLLQNNNKSIVVVAPEKGKQSNIESNFLKEMETIKNHLSEKEMQQLMAQNKAFEKYQAEEDSPEIINQIPFLHIDEINKKADILPTQKIPEQYDMIFTPLETNGIVYSQLSFDTCTVPENLYLMLDLLQV